MAQLTSTAQSQEWFPELIGCVTAMAKFITGLDRAGDFLTDDEAIQISDAGLAYLRQYAFLARRSLAKRESLWKIRPKHHYFHHMVLNVRVQKVNLSRTQCFHGEDFMGKTKNLARRCHRRSVQNRALERYIQLIGARWMARKAVS